jgi:urea transport system ATP-binding protein
VKLQSGVVEFDGKPLTGPTWKRIRKGIGRKFQIPRVFPRLTSQQNLLLATSRVRKQPDAAELDIDEIRGIQGAALSHGWRQRLEFLMVTSQQPHVAVLDEPTAGMTKAERSHLAELILRYRGRSTYLIVEHDMDFVKNVADRVSFMHEGRVIASGTFAEIEQHPIVRQIYLGEGYLGEGEGAGGNGHA